MKIIVLSLVSYLIILFFTIHCGSINNISYMKSEKFSSNDTILHKAQYGLADCNLNRYLIDSIYPKLTNCLAPAYGIDYSGYFYVTISETGKVSNVDILRVNYMSGCEDKIVNQIFKMEKWIPGTKNGKAVTTYRIIEIIYKKAG